MYDNPEGDYGGADDEREVAKVSALRNGESKENGGAGGEEELGALRVILRMKSGGRPERRSCWHS